MMLSQETCCFALQSLSVGKLEAAAVFPQRILIGFLPTVDFYPCRFLLPNMRFLCLPSMPDGVCCHPFDEPRRM
jgi:hypothetical protein